MRRYHSHLSRWSGIALLALLVATAAAERARPQVVINEVLASNRLTNFDEDGESSDWVELYNDGASVVDLTSYALTDDPADLAQWTFPPVSLAPNGYLLVWCSGKDRKRIPEDDIEGRDSPHIFVPALISLDDTWRVLSGAPEDPGPPANWMAPGFDDSGWQTGKPGFGFGNDDEIQTRFPEDGGPIFVRKRFEFQPGLLNLVLQLRYDDGFVAYLNGVRVASDNFPEGEEPTFASLSDGSNSARAGRETRFDLTDNLDLLTPGENVLAIVVLNTRVTSNDLILYPELGTVPPVFHTNFELDAGGEPVVLVDADGAVADEVDLPEQATDHSYARSPDGTGTFKFHSTPTPREPNAGPTGDAPLLVKDTTFSHDRGFYEEPFDLEIASKTEGALIRYTLDGSEPTETNGIDYEGPVPVSGTTTIRARAFKQGLEPTNVDTQTYLFLDDVITQTRESTLEAGFPPRWGGVAADYGLDPDVIGPNRFGGIYAASIRDDLASLPSLSIVLDIDDVFGPRGIYTNSGNEGVQWERPTSAELIYPDGTPGFHVNCGLRIQGGYFRQPSATPKHSLRLLFKGIYGAPKLEYDWFGNGATDRFDTITLRAGANDGYSWNAARLTEQYTRDEFGRRLQIATGNAGGHGAFVHLYINGVYWGLYNPTERPDRSFSASYYGGDKDEWDSVHDLRPTAGDLDAWNLMVSKAAAARTVAGFQELQGRNPDGTPNPDFPHLLDVPNYIDYLTVNVWGGNWDWPWKNWWAARDRSENSNGFKFYCWDFENTMGNNRSRSDLRKNALQNDFSSAGVPHTRLMSSEEYRVLFADRIHRLFFNGGVLTPESLIPRYRAIADEVERAIVAESARWGDQHHSTPLTLREWTTERDWLLETYLPQRTEIVLEQFQQVGLYPRLEAPVFNVHGGLVARGFRLLPRAPEGTIYYTTDGSDPRIPGGEISPTAQVADTGEKVTLLPADSLARVHVPTNESLGLDWVAMDFDDSAWREGPQAIGYDTRDDYHEFIGTDVLESLHDINSSIYIRIPFDVDDPSSLVFLNLRMRYDDGYVAYLNGERVASRNARDELTWDARASSSHSDRLAVEFELAELSGAEALLRPGRNILALHAFNFRETDSDFLIQAELEATIPSADQGIVINGSTKVQARAFSDDTWSALNEATFIVDEDVPLRITEIMYHPLPDGSEYDADEFEFVELRNIGAAPLDLSEVRLRGGIEFEFAGSAVETLAGGERVVVVENLEAFRTRYDTTNILVAGQYRGKLSNAGETLIIEGYLEQQILAFEFDDAWYEETDGEGHSLVIVDELLPRENWGEKASWMPSPQIGGSPGLDDSGEVDPGGRQRPGDASQDGQLNLTDAVLLLNYLFGGDAPRLPCDGDTIASGANRLLMDVDGGGSVNLADATFILNYLFQRGAPPVPGTECIRIRGCPDVCVR